MVEKEAELDEIWPELETAGFKENVATMKREDLNVCTAQLGVKPIKMCAGQMGWCRRPMFFWPKDFGPFGNSEIWLEEQEDWYK